MSRWLWAVLGLMVVGGLVSAQEYQKKGSKAETAIATLKAFGFPTLEKNWSILGPFPFDEESGFDDVLLAEKPGADVKAEYTGVDGKKVKYQEPKEFRLGKVLNLYTTLKIPYATNVTGLLRCEFDSKTEFTWPIDLGSDDTLTVHFNGERVYHEKHFRAAAPDQDHVELKVKTGKNVLLIKIGQYAGGWEAYVAPGLPDG
ncbi:MAG: hypothetical protein ACRCZF_01050, partial [Gemmataceae bacterium]